MKPFEYLEHTADVKFRAYGHSSEEMLSNAALALFNSMIDTATVKSKETWKVELFGADLEQLAYHWLSEIIFLFETEFAVFSKFDVKLHQDQGGQWSMQATIGGEKIDSSRHAFDNEVKAVTLHEFEVKKNDLWCIQVVLDV
jgi:SHS2 domain-containing protein